MRKIKLVGVFMILLSSALSYGQQTIKMFVKENKATCQGVGPMECFMVKYKNHKDWQLFYDAIDGFNYEAGNLYEIAVVKTKKKGTIPADASAYTYTLKKIISKTPVNSIKGIYNTKMVLSALNEKKVSTTNVFITIDPGTQTISGKSGCNAFTVKYTELRSKGQLQTNLPFGNLKACDKESMKLEHDFLAAIKDKKFKVARKNNKVQFKNLKNKTVLEFSIPT